MKKYIALALFLLSACASTPPIEMNINDICRLENNGKKITTVGYITSPNWIFCSNTSGRMECGMNLTATPNGEKIATADIKEGSGKNAVRNPKKYKPLQFKDAHGQTFGDDTHVKLTGKLTSTEDSVSHNPICYIEVFEFEQTP